MAEDIKPEDQGNAQAQQGKSSGPATGGGTSSRKNTGGGTPAKAKAGKGKGTAAADDQPERRPPYYIACAPLFIGGPSSGALPVRAFSTGDRVPPDHVDKYGWGTLVAWPASFAASAPAADTSDDDQPAKGDEE